MQEKINGTEYVVDCVSANDEHFITNICKYKKVKKNGSAFVYREMKFLEPHNYKELNNYITKVLNSLELTFGPSHSELIINEINNELTLIETGSRLHGGFGPKIVEECSSHSLINMAIYSYIDQPKFQSLTKTPATLKKEAVEHFLINNKKGIITSINFLNEIKLLPSYSHLVCGLKIGDHIEPTTSLANTPAWIVLIHDNKEQLLNDQQYIISIEDKIFNVE